MREEDRGQNLHDSMFDFLRLTLDGIETEWNTLRPTQSISLNLTPDEATGQRRPKEMGLHIEYLTEDDDIPDSLRSGAMVELSTFVREDRFLDRFIRSRVFKELGIRKDRNETRGFVPYKDFASNPNAPLSRDLIIIEPLVTYRGSGWREIKPGDDERVFDDPSVVHHVANLILQY